MQNLFKLEKNKKMDHLMAETCLISLFVVNKNLKIIRQIC